MSPKFADSINATLFWCQRFRLFRILCTGGAFGRFRVLSETLSGVICSDVFINNFISLSRHTGLENHRGGVMDNSKCLNYSFPYYMVIFQTNTAMTNLD